MLVEFPEEIDLQDDERIRVKGKLYTTYYQPFQATILYLVIEE